MNKTVFITGATSGFGKAMAEKFSSNGWSCIITGRRKEKLLAVADELKEKYAVKSIAIGV
jgi:3-hydroxy acid dehydrogenase/malonic semialdehyde reductase